MGLQNVPLFFTILTRGEVNVALFPMAWFKCEVVKRANRARASLRASHNFSFLRSGCGSGAQPLKVRTHVLLLLVIAASAWWVVLAKSASL